MKSMVFIILLIASIAQVGCQNTAQNALVGDFSPSSTCPNGGCVVTSGNGATSAYITAASSQYAVGANDQRIDIGGECFDGNIAQNRIWVTYDSSSYSSPALPASLTPITTGTINNQVSLVCKNGHFDFSIPSTVLTQNSVPLGSSLRIRLTLQLYDAYNNPVKAGARSSIAIALVRMN